MLYTSGCSSSVETLLWNGKKAGTGPFSGSCGKYIIIIKRGWGGGGGILKSQSKLADEEQQLTLSLISSIRERLKPEFLFSDFMALMAPDLISILACSVAVAVSTTGWSERAVEQTSVRCTKQILTCLFSKWMHMNPASGFKGPYFFSSHSGWSG